MIKTTSGGGLGGKSVNDPEVHPPAHQHPCEPSRSAVDRAAAVPSGGPDRGRVRVRGLDVRPIRGGVHRVRGEHIRVARAASGDRAYHRHAAGRQGVRCRQLRHAHHQGSAPRRKAFEEAASSVRSTSCEPHVVAGSPARGGGGGEGRAGKVARAEGGGPREREIREP